MNPLVWLNPGRWIMLFAAVAALTFGVHALDKSRQAIGYDKAQAEYTAAALIASEAAREKDRLVQQQIFAITKSKDEKISTINSRLVVANSQLLDRAERRDAAAPTPCNCKGGTGADLSRPDGQFLVGEAARADILRTALEACYAQYDTLTGK